MCCVLCAVYSSVEVCSNAKLSGQQFEGGCQLELPLNGCVPPFVWDACIPTAFWHAEVEQ